ncbi:MAG TPA: MxaS protein [Methylibium sp.]|nr:MxaS protein [Methylibium sp.]
MSSDPAARHGHEPAEFHYKLPQRYGGQRPGAHHGTSLGAGQQFAAHRRLLDHPDPRRIDLRASLRDVNGDWLVRIARQRVAVPVHALVDVSASMRFGARRAKLAVVADFVDALGHSAFRAGDPVGLLAFDEAEREDLFLPARHSRGVGSVMAEMLRSSPASPPQPKRHGKAHAVDPLAGLRHCAARLAGRRGLVFLVSDFHGMAVEALAELLDLLTPAVVLPVLVWDPAEAAPPEADALLAVSDAETGVRRTLWLREALRRQWRGAVATRREELHALFDARALPPFELIDADGRFDAEALTRHFMECVA